MKTIQRLENSEYVKSEVLVFKKSVLEKKNSYNKIHHENLVKEETLEQLEQQLEMLVSQCDNYSGQQNSLKARDYECKALNRKLKEQLKDQEILENMIITKKTQFNSMAEPIKNKKKIIETLSTLIEKHSRDIKKESGQIIQSTKELERANKYLNKLHEEKEQKIEIKIKTFADKKKFRYCMKKEKEKNQTLETHTNKAKDLLDLEFRLTKLKEDELLSEEIKNIEAHCLREEQKFLAIQKVTNIVSVSEMYPHFMYLIENQERLKGCVESTLRKIEDLSRIREELSKDLEELKLKTLNNQQYNKEIQAMEDKFKLRALFIDNYEEYVEKIENVVVTSINSISRLVYQLDLVNEVGELDSENLMECFKRCRNKLDILIDFIKKNDFEAIESINTDINFKRSPNFLKLNTKPLNKNPLQ